MKKIAPGPAFARMRAARGAREAASGGGPREPTTSERIRAQLMPQQLAVIDDPCQYKSVKVPRRGGKTVTAAAYLIDFALNHPGCRMVFGSMTLKSAKRLIWTGRDGLKRWDTKYDLGIDFNNADTSATFPNGSVLMVMGFETQGDVDKIRGEALDLVILDECKSFPPRHFDELVDEAIAPALLDMAGTLVIMGTPGAVLRGRFFEATSTEGSVITVEENGYKHARCRPYGERDEEKWRGVNFEWSFHSWSTAENTAHVVQRRDGTTATIWDEMLAMKRRKRWSDSHPVWRREGLGHWVADNSVLVYDYVAARNGWSPKLDEDTNHLGLDKNQEWHYGLGADLGFDNLFALEVVAWCETLPSLWQVYEYGEARLTNKGIMAALKRAREVIGKDFDFMVADRGNLGKAQLASLEEEYSIFFEAADKHEKNAHIEIVNSDFREARLFVRKDSRLAAEMEVLPWRLPRGVFDLAREGAPLIRKYEDDSFAKDHCDAFLYCVTRAQHRLQRIRESLAPRPGDDGFDKWWYDEHKRQAFAPKKREMDGGWRGHRIDGRPPYRA